MCFRVIERKLSNKILKLSEKFRYYFKKIVVNIILECDFPVTISAIENKIREMFVIVISDLEVILDN